MKHDDKYYLDLAGRHAKACTTCLKVGVGAVFVPDEDPNVTILAANMGEHSCKEAGECHKFKVTGIYKSCEETRKFCASKHAEINLIEKLRSTKYDIKSGTEFTSRYPCLNCATKLCEAGVTRVVYGGRQEISDEVKEVFNKYNVEVKWYPECDYED